MHKLTKQDVAMGDGSSITKLSTRESLDFLSGKSFGRLAVVLNGKPDIFPINFLIHAITGDHAVAYIRTSPGNKLFAIASGLPVALEADEVEGSSALSAIVYGKGRIVRQPQELELVESLGLYAWIADWKPEFVAIDIDQISGRRFILGPGPDGVITEPPDRPIVKKYCAERSCHALRFPGTR